MLLIFYGNLNFTAEYYMNEESTTLTFINELYIYSLNIPATPRHCFFLSVIQCEWIENGSSSSRFYMCIICLAMAMTVLSRGWNYVQQCVHWYALGPARPCPVISVDFHWKLSSPGDLYGSHLSIKPFETLYVFNKGVGNWLTGFEWALRLYMKVNNQLHSINRSSLT